MAALACALLLASGCGGDDDEQSSERPQGAERARTGAETTPPEVREAEGGSPADEDEEAPDPPDPAAQAVRAYVRALNERDAEKVCSLLAPGALRGVDLPRGGPGCEESLAASIGYADPRGFPQWKSTRFQDVESVSRQGNEARVTAAVYHVFADRTNVSVEDDVVYLRRIGGRWQIAKASATLYRAIGAPEVPLDALQPPR